MKDCDHVSQPCRFRIDPDLQRRPANALNIEIGFPMPRCILKTPENWEGTSVTAARWLLSGGDVFVFGICTCNCPLKENKDSLVQ